MKEFLYIFIVAIKYRYLTFVTNNTPTKYNRNQSLIHISIITDRTDIKHIVKVHVILILIPIPRVERSVTTPATTKENHSRRVFVTLMKNRFALYAFAERFSVGASPAICHYTCHPAGRTAGQKLRPSGW